MSTRDIVVAGALPRHQVRRYLEVMGVDYWWQHEDPHRDTAVFHITDATDEQWTRIQDWVKKVTG